MNPKNKRIYWVDLGQGDSAVYSTEFSGSGLRAVIKSGLRVPEDVAYDHVGDNVYITDSGLKKIIVCKDDGSFCSILFDDIERPRSLAIDPEMGYMYWSEWGIHAGIYMAGMDGSDRQTLAHTDIEWPNGLTFDKSTNRIYWADAKLNRIEYFELTTKKRSILVQDTVFHPFSMAVFEDNLYWSDWDTFTLDVCNKFTGRNQSIVLREKDKHMMGIHIYHPALYPRTRTSPCWSHSCTHMCLVGPRGSRRCACPAHMRLDQDGETCIGIKKSFALVSVRKSVKRIYPETIGKDVVETMSIPHHIAVGDFTYDPDNDVMFVFDMVKYVIVAVSMSSGNSSTLVQGQLGSVQGLTYDHCTRNLYWLESGRGLMEAMSTVTKARAVLIKDLERPMDMTLNQEDKLVFIANLGTEPYILQANMDGSNQIKLFSGPTIGLPVAVVYVAEENKLYWSDAKKGTIESSLLSDADSGRRVVVRENLGHVMSLAIHSNILYWTDMDHGYLFHAAVDRTNEKPQLVPLPGDHAASTMKKIKMVDADYEHQHDSHDDFCAEQNGGCSHLCLLGPHGPVCTCPEGFEMKTGSDKTCIKKEMCDEGDFKCHDNSKCILLEYKCDQNEDCDDGSDELNCSKTCPPDDWQCANKKCIIGVWRCDRNNDCGDNSDEMNCTEQHNCGEGHFNCGDGQCIPQLWKCDSHPDCANKMDEENCTTNACHKDSNQLQCGDGSCVPTQWKCDGEADCPDAADEKGCEEKQCNENEFKCGNHACIDKSLVCDGHRDCNDNKDEKDCTVVAKCGAGQIPYCADGHCIYEADLCDGHMDCDHGEDEKNCTNKRNPCSEHESYCGSNVTLCIPNVWICDGENDCGDWSDENKPQCMHRNEDMATTTTSRPCKDGSYPCGSGECVPYEVVCNGHRDCLDGSDESETCTAACRLKTECAQGCRDTPNGAMCICKEGYELANDSIACLDVDECSALGHCSQKCENTKGSFKCSCAPGYMLTGDQKRCKAMAPGDPNQPSNVQVVYMLPDRIRALDLVNHAEHLLVQTEDADIKGMDLDYKTKSVFWVESEKGTLNKKRVSFDGSPGGNITTLRSDLVKPMHLSWDWIGRNFYFFSEGYIAVCSENASICRNVIPTGFVMINSLVVVPEHGILFFSIWSGGKNSSGLIERSDMNGGRRAKIIQRDIRIQWPNGLTADAILQRLYWTDATKGQVGSSDFRGNDRKTLLAYALAHPFGLAYFEDNLYIANMGSDTMIKCSKFNGRSRLIAHRGNIKSESMRMYHAVLQHQSDNPCLNASCHHLCLLTQNGTTCSCGDGYSISSDGMTCELDPDAIPFAGKSADSCGCLNGGYCDADHACVCTDNFSGVKCEISLLAQTAPVHGARIFSYTLTILGLMCVVLILAIFVNYYFEGPVTMDHVRSLSPSRLRNSRPFRNIVISFRNPLFKRGEDSLIESEETDYDSGPEEDNNMNYTYGPAKEEAPKKKQNRSRMVRNMSSQSALSDYQTATFEPLPGAVYDAANQTFTINVSYPGHEDEDKLLP